MILRKAGGGRGLHISPHPLKKFEASIAPACPSNENATQEGVEKTLFSTHGQPGPWQRTQWPNQRAKLLQCHVPRSGESNSSTDTVSVSKKCRHKHRTHIAGLKGVLQRLVLAMIEKAPCCPGRGCCIALKLSGWFGYSISGGLGGLAV